MPIVLGIKQNPVVPSVIDPGANWVFLGDSQTLGRASGPATSHASAICQIWQTMRANGRLSIGPATPYSGFPTNPFRDGLSGRSLADTIAAYEDPENDAVRAAATMIWIQESGNQNWAGQTTAAAFKATYKANWQARHAERPTAVKVNETAFSFGREGEAFRNWDPYNVAMLEANTELAAEGINIIVVDTDAGVKALQAILTPGDVWYQSGHPDAYHYNELGNTLVAVLGLKALGITCILSDLADISGVSDTNKQHAIDVADSL